jgi:hypothetical protein
MFDKEAGNVIDVNPEQPKNALIPMVVKEAGNVIDVKLEQ